MARTRSNTIVPTAGLFLVALASVAVLPSALRPPPDTANNSAALSPDAPPEENPDAIISSFQQAASATAGATRSTATTVPSTTTTTAPPPQSEPSRGLCFGDPPRQTESVYSPLCKPAFQGDNGGATYPGVDAEEVRVAFWHPLGTPAEGRIPTEPQPGESAETRTWRVLQAYFNQRYEFSGRRLQLVAMAAPDAGDPGTRAAAIEAADEWDVFAASHTEPLFCDTLVQRGRVCINENPIPGDVLNRSDPHWFGYQMATDQHDRLVADYLCKRIVGHPAAHAGADLQGGERKVGLLYEDGRTYRTAQQAADAIRSACGYEALAFNVQDPAYDGGGGTSISTAIARFRQQGVTSIVVSSTLTPVLVAMQAADSSLYYPEWILTGGYGLENNVVGLTYPAAQAAHLFGLSYTEIPRPNRETDCFRAYMSVDPSNEPDGASCAALWYIVEQIIIGIHEAGPELTPTTWRDGYYDYGKLTREQVYAVQGSYSPGDHSFVDEMGEVWWDAAAINPTTSGPGAFVWTQEGRRHGIGEFPPSPNPELFVGGYATPPRGSD